MAHKKGVGSSRNGRDSNPQYRGIKRYGGEHVTPGSIIVRQCGTKIRPGVNVGLGRDYTIYSLVDGYVKFETHSRTQKRVSVYPAAQIAADTPATAAEVAETTPAKKPAAKKAAPAAPVAEASSKPAAKPAASAAAGDDLKLIEGIGPKIAGVLEAAGVTTFAQLAATSAEQIEEIVKDAGVRLADASTWPEQAALAAKGDWDGLKTLQDSLKGGRKA